MHFEMTDKIYDKSVAAALDKFYKNSLIETRAEVGEYFGNEYLYGTR